MLSALRLALPTTLRERAVAGGAVVAVVLAAVVVGRAIAAPAAPTYHTEAVKRASVQQTVTLVGALESAADVHLTFRPGGTLAEVLVKVGQQVTAGQALARLDTAELKVALSQAQASLALAQARYDDVTAGARPEDVALARQAVEAARVVYDQAQRATVTDLSTAQRAVETATSDLAQAQRDRATSVDGALQAFERTKTSFASARADFAAQVSAAQSAVAAYESAIAPVRTTIEAVLDHTKDLAATPDLDAARTSLNAADTHLATAQGYVTDVLAPALSAYTSAVAEVTSALAAFDAAIAAGADPTAAVSRYLGAEGAYALSASRMRSAIAVPNVEVTTALTLVTSAKTSLDTLDEQDRYVLDTDRAGITSAASALASLDQQATAIGTKVSQGTTSLATVTTTVNGGYVTSRDAYTTAVSRGDAAVRLAQDRLASARDTLTGVSDRDASSASSLEIALRNAQTTLARTTAGAKATEIAQALAGVQAAQATVDQATLALERATLTAPAAGRVSAVPVHAGETVGAPADVVVLALTSTIALHGTVGETEVGKIALGQPADVIVQTAGAEARRTGHVTAVDPAATIVAGVPTYGVDVTVDGADGTIHPGMTATARIVVASKDAVLTVPSAAVRVDGARTFVRVLAGGAPVERDVVLGLRTGTVSEVVSGLEEGQPVVVPEARSSVVSGITVSASQPFTYGAAVEPSVQRYAVLVTVTNGTEDDLTFSPSDILARDAARHLYPADPKAAAADARAVRAEAQLLGMVGIQPLPGMTLRKDDVLEGFVVFDLPAGVRPAQIVFRQTDQDHVVDLAAR